MQFMSDTQNADNITNNKCKYFPCHDLDENEFDCRTCYCPIYDICAEKKDKIFGGYWLKDTVWACEKCTYIHKKEVVQKIIKLKQQDISNKEIYIILKEDFKNGNNKNISM